MKLNIQHKDLVETIDADGNLCYTYSFIPTSADDELVLSSKEWADVSLENIMLNKGSEVLPFEENKPKKSLLQQMFDNLGEFSLEFKNYKQATEHTIHATAQGLTEAIANNDKQQKAELLKTSEAWRLKLEDAKRALNNQITSTADGILVKLNDGNRNLSARIDTTAEGLQAKLSKLATDTDGKTAKLESKITSTAEGLRAEIARGDSGLKTELQTTAGALTASLADTKRNLESRIDSTAEVIRQTVRDPEAMGRIVLGSKLFSVKVDELKRDATSKADQAKQGAISEANRIKASLSSEIRQTKNSIDLSLRDYTKKNEIVSQINVNREGVRIKGDLIHLNGRTLIDDGVIKSAMIESLSADKINAGVINANHVRLINLDAYNIVNFNSRVENLTASKIQAPNGRMTWWLNQNELEFRNGAGINFRDTNNYLYRIKNSDYAFIRFGDDKTDRNGIVIGVNRNSSFDPNNMWFTGLRFFPSEDHISMLTDKLSIRGGYDEPNGWWFESHNDLAKFRPFTHSSYSMIGDEGHPVKNIWVERLRRNGSYVWLQSYNDDTITLTKFGGDGVKGRRGINYANGACCLDIDGQMYHFADCFKRLGLMTSDIKAKERVKRSTETALDTLEKLGLFEFDYRKEIYNDVTQIKGHVTCGLIAQQAEKVNPMFVIDPIEEEHKSRQFKSINAFMIIPYLVKGIQELHAKVKELEEWKANNNQH